MDEPSPSCDPLGLPSPWDRSLSRDISGRLIDSDLGESSTISWLEAKGVGEVGASLTLIGPHTSSGLGAS
jgi:hypothetical protein